MDVPSGFWLQEILAFRSTWEVQGLNSVRQLFSFYGCNLGSLNFFKHWSHAKVDWNLISATSHRDGCDRLVRLVVMCFRLYIYIYIRVFTVSIPSSSSRYGNSSHMDCPMILPYFSQWTPSGNATWQQPIYLSMERKGGLNGRSPKDVPSNRKSPLIPSVTVPRGRTDGEHHHLLIHLAHQLK